MTRGENPFGYNWRGYTNESLEAIWAGLQPTPEDLILAVCSCGDQPFALALGGSTVVAVDQDATALEYAKHRLTLCDAPEQFLKPEAQPSSWAPDDQQELAWRNAFFRKEHRLETLKRNKHNISFVQDDILYGKALETQQWTQVYLSNAVGFSWHRMSFESEQRDTKTVVDRVAPGGLIYSTEHRCAEDADLRWKGLPVKLEEERSARARELEHPLWRPSVYRRI